MSHSQILIIGGGNAGISVAAQLILKNRKLDVTIVDPADKHYYQPAWTLVGGGVFDVRKTERPEESVIPKGVKWVKEKVSLLSPDENSITLEGGGKLSYDYLIVAPGIQLDWNMVKGLEETLGKNNVCSNYSFRHAPYTFECIRNFKGGRAVFHNPHTLVKCGGAPMKIMFMAADYFRKKGILENSDIEFYSGSAKLFAVDKYQNTLLKVVERNNIKLNFLVRLEEVDGPNKRAKFVGIGENNKLQEEWVDFDMMHVTPPQSAPDFVKKSSLVNDSGWVDVNKYTLQHNRYSNIFSIGDVSGLPTSKTGAAIRKQAPVLVKNLLSLISREPLKEAYSGYTSCPIVTGYGKLVLAEFDYTNQPKETFPFDQSKERWSMYQLKKTVLPWLYWNKILTGKL